MAWTHYSPCQINVSARRLPSCPHQHVWGVKQCHFDTVIGVFVLYILHIQWLCTCIYKIFWSYHSKMCAALTLCKQIPILDWGIKLEHLVEWHFESFCNRSLNFVKGWEHFTLYNTSIFNGFMAILSLHGLQECKFHRHIPCVLLGSCLWSSERAEPKEKTLVGRQMSSQSVSLCIGLFIAQSLFFFSPLSPSFCHCCWFFPWTCPSPTSFSPHQRYVVT